MPLKPRLSSESETFWCNAWARAAAPASPTRESVRSRRARRVLTYRERVLGVP